jgi:FtsP/CotA-like multicopper oxidase with cupredoxin domain
MPRFPGPQYPTRRQFVRLTAASAAALATGSISSLLTACSGELLAPPADPGDLAPGTGIVTRNALRIPGTVGPTSSLTARTARVDLGGGRLSNVLGYNGLFPGPTVVAATGTRVSIPFTNALSEKSTIHWHGMIVPTSADGHPRDAVQPGRSYAYTYTIDQRAALNWYHPHPHMITGKQVCLGLAGAFIVRDSIETGLGLPKGAYEIPLIIRDASLDSSGNLVYNSGMMGMMGGFLGTIPLVNGVRDPYLNVDTALYRLRVLNGANARVFRLALNNGAQFSLIGNDGGLLETTVRLSQITIAPGERLDLIVDFRGLPVGTRVMLRDAGAGWDLLEFRVTRQVSVAGSIPMALSAISKLSSAVTTRRFSFDGMSRINGKVYDLNRVDFQVPFGQTERWRFVASMNGSHPVHVHGASFQVQSRTGGRNRVFPWERGWKDTVLLQGFETVDVLIRFNRFRGLYLLHCHNLEHEDMGMMSNFEVV